MDAAEIQFQGRTFCFTGTIVGMKRTQAERETRSRGGLTVPAVNERLDYLVIGSTPSRGWAHGSYGRKIETARSLAKMKGIRLVLVPEGLFLDALAFATPNNSGAIDAKVVVATYKFGVSGDDDYDQPALIVWLQHLRSTDECHITARAYYVRMLDELFSSPSGESKAPSHSIIVEYRIVKQLPVGAPSEPFIEKISLGFEKIGGVDGTLRWFERTEGTSGYVRLLEELPQSLRLDGF